MKLTRRDVLRIGTGAAGAWLARDGGTPLFAQGSNAATAPSLPVAIGQCKEYEHKSVHATLATLFDRIGGIRSLVNGKTVAMKLNLTGDPGRGEFGIIPGRSYQTHASVALAATQLFFQNGAKRVRLLESAYWEMEMEEYVALDHHDPKEFARLGNVEWEDTHNLGKGKQYHRLKVPWGGYVFPAFDVNHSYVDCDVYVSLAKLKNHVCGGVTLSLKNTFAMAPTSIYGGEAHRKGERALSARSMLHSGNEQPAQGAPAELNPSTPRNHIYRVPRIVADLCGCRPIHLAIIDGIEACAGGEGPWNGTLRRTTPGVLVVGRNAVNTDAVCTGIIGYDPTSGHGQKPFPGANHLQLLADQGLGTNDLKRIEVRGTAIKDVLYPYGEVLKS